MLAQQVVEIMEHFQYSKIDAVNVLLQEIADEEGFEEIVFDESDEAKQSEYKQAAQPCQLEILPYQREHSCHYLLCRRRVCADPAAYITHGERALQEIKLWISKIYKR